MLTDGYFVQINPFDGKILIAHGVPHGYGRNVHYGNELGKIMLEIVKVQIPLNGPGEALIYAKDRTRVVRRDLYPHEVKQMGDDVKAYFEGIWSTVLGWSLAQRVEDQDW